MDASSPRPDTPVLPRDLPAELPRELLHRLQRRSDARGFAMLAANWALVVAAFALVLAWPGVASVLVALVVLGGRQLGLGILMHECAHRSMFRTPSINEFVGQWLCAAPMGADLAVYRAYHMTHHVQTGTDADPDLANYAGYPVTRASMARKAVRDLAGVTGAKALVTLAVLYAQDDPRALRTGYAYRRPAAASPDPVRPSFVHRAGRLLWNARRIAIVQAAGFSVLWALGHPLAYVLWPAAWLTTYMLFARIRNAAEHGALPGTATTDVWANTRTVSANWLERLTVAPNHVNHHLEHHLAPTVPAWRLPELHRWLAAHGALPPASVASGYLAVLRSLTGTPRRAA
jgi:fatty acid desaturase